MIKKRHDNSFFSEKFCINGYFSISYYELDLYKSNENIKFFIKKIILIQ
ncbi:Uncharacterised protein [Proteus mirabilis]|uniref:Uncharacterized protein n=1 Tax=Proteus mirabilis TaxID=584 RepID=A0A2X2BFC2_PROMI|nr:Uncharacterised protein [Proteus mirabilis]